MSVSPPASTVLQDVADCTRFCTIRRSASPEAWCASQLFFVNSSLSMKMNRGLFLPVSQKQVLLHCDRGVPCKCHRCASIAFWPCLVSHVLRVITSVTIKYYYGISVLVRYILSVLVDKCVDPRDHGSR